MTCLTHTPPKKQVKDLHQRNTGRFYTHQHIGTRLVNQTLTWFIAHALEEPRDVYKIIDPFAGDGRLLVWFIEALHASGLTCKLEVTAWDLSSSAIVQATENIESAIKRAGFEAELFCSCHDTFTKACEHFGNYSVCITNPPWENLKPDARELGHLTEKEKFQHLTDLKELDRLITSLYPNSAPDSKFSGWGTNLSRAGTECALKLLSRRGVCGIVTPASILADKSSRQLRKWLLTSFSPVDIAYYEAECRLFENVDQPCIATVIKTLKLNGGSHQDLTEITGTCSVQRVSPNGLKTVELSLKDVSSYFPDELIMPVHFGAELIRLLNSLYADPIENLESSNVDGIWMGRELDETNHSSFLIPTGEHAFIKGRMIQRFSRDTDSALFVNKELRDIPASSKMIRIAWRDVSRPSQRRRVQASLIYPHEITGNSLHVAYFRNQCLYRTKLFLGFLSSLVCEAQIRMRLATAHVSLAAVRKAKIPSLQTPWGSLIVSLVDKCMNGDSRAEPDLEVAVARAYGLSLDQFEQICDCFPKLDKASRTLMRTSPIWSNMEMQTAKAIETSKKRKSPQSNIRTNTTASTIPNHAAPSLSKLDLEMAVNIPPGGNWKNIPDGVPSNRVAKIRDDFKKGLGSRSTYYGRLQPHLPSYTINTYYSRPGNGCHLHYDYKGQQHRTISHREAARLQSFPDTFIFKGSQRAVAQQIGNAVPPLLSFTLAELFPQKGIYLDLFCGAGGLSLGFLWNGWKPIAGNDIDKSALDTYSQNIHKNVILGDIREDTVFQQLLLEAEKARRQYPDLPLIILGGPPCQGFSTAGNKRSLEDARNWLFLKYCSFIHAVKPDAFIFENVTGLLTMEKGKVAAMVTAELAKTIEVTKLWKIHAQDYGIPQRRSRVLIIGHSKACKLPSNAPEPITSSSEQASLFDSDVKCISCDEALSDLPRLEAGEDGSQLDYGSEPSSQYQQLMRGIISPRGYFQTLTRHFSLL